MKRPTIAQVAGRALILLLQKDDEGALRELSRHHEATLRDGEPVLVDVQPQHEELELCTDCGQHHDFGMCPIEENPSRIARWRKEISS